MILSNLEKRITNRLRRRVIAISTLRPMIFGMFLPRGKILSARFGQRLIIASVSSSFDCVCGKRRITGLRCGERNPGILPDSVAWASCPETGGWKLALQSGRMLELHETLLNHWREPWNWPRD